MKPLEGPRSKLQRAREHVALLTSEFEAWSQSLEIEALVDESRRQVILKVVAVPEVPLRWSTILGDAVHNYRCVLDHLVWQLARANQPPNQPLRNTLQFPIVSEKANWADQHFRIAQISKRHQAQIESMQPYHRGYWMGAGPPRQPLEDLRDLSNVDKHRFVVVTTYGAGETPRVRVESATGITFGQAHYLVGLSITIGTEIAYVDIKEWPEPDDYDLSLSYEPSTYFAFPGGAKIELVLAQIDGAVEAILELMARETALLGETHPDLRSDTERELVALTSLRSRLVIVLERLLEIGGTGVQFPDPYLPLKAFLEDLRRLWDDDFSQEVKDPDIAQIVERAFICKEDPESHGLVEHSLDGARVFERHARYPELAGQLETVLKELDRSTEQRIKTINQPRD